MASLFTLVVRCADPRVEHFFVGRESRVAMGLDAERVEMAEAYIANVGGLLPLAGAEVPRLVHDASLLVRLFAEERSRIVLTAHSKCGGYQDAVEGEEAAVRARQIDDLATTAHRLREALPQTPVDAYYLDLATGDVERVDV